MNASSKKIEVNNEEYPVGDFHNEISLSPLLEGASTVLDEFAEEKQGKSTEKKAFELEDLTPSEIFSIIFSKRLEREIKINSINADELNSIEKLLKQNSEEKKKFCEQKLKKIHKKKKRNFARERKIKKAGINIGKIQISSLTINVYKGDSKNQEN